MEDASQVCRRNGWKVGDRLAGDEGYGLDVLEIVYVGEAFLAKKIGRVVDGVLVERPGCESMWVLGPWRSWRLWRRPRLRARAARRLVEMIGRLM